MCFCSQTPPFPLSPRILSRALLARGTKEKKKSANKSRSCPQAQQGDRAARWDLVSNKALRICAHIPDSEGYK